MSTHSRRPFYGWIIAVYAAVVAFSSGPGQSYVFSVFIDPIIEETGFSRTLVSALYAVGTAVSAVAVFTVSRVADRFGPRRVLIFVGLGLCGACFLIASAHGLLMFAVSFAVLRALGQGSLPINATLLTASWFIRFRGRALAVMGLGFAASTSLLPPVSRALIDGLGWREAYMVLGVTVALLIVPAAIFLVRDSPEEMSLHPDGDPRVTAPRVPASTSNAIKTPLLRTSQFWLLALPLATSPFIVTALVFHQVGILGEKGLGPGAAASIFFPYAVTSALASLTAGFLVDRWGPRPVFVAAMSLLAGALAFTFVLDSVFLALGYGALLGATGGISQLVSGASWAHYYGRDGLGRVQGSATMVGISAAALGPLPLAGLQQAFDGFGTGIALMLPLPVLAAAAFWVSGRRPPFASTPPA